MDERTIKTPNPICRLFFKIDLLTDFAAFMVGIAAFMVGIFDLACELLPPMDEGTILVYNNNVYYCPSTFSLTSPAPSSLPKINVQYCSGPA
jgi:hypothetical protein